MVRNNVSAEANDRSRDLCLAHFGKGNGAHPAVGFAGTKITGANDDDAEQILLQHESAEPYWPNPASDVDWQIDHRSKRDRRIRKWL